VPIRDGRRRHLNHRTANAEASEAIREFIRNLEARESHYSRERNPGKKYLAANTTKRMLFAHFMENNPHFAEIEDQSINLNLFSRIFDYEFNIAFGYPRSDLCDRCELFNVRRKTAERYNNAVELAQIQRECELHWQEADIFYNKIRESAVEDNDEIFAACADFEKNFNFPITGVNKEYFLSNLNFYNFGIQNIRTNHVAMIMYAQHFAKKGANETATFLQYYLREQAPPTARNVKIFMDNSVGTNKNRFVIAMLQQLALTRFESIELVFPVVGHSYMPIDRSFAIAEKKKKKSDKIVSPEDWTSLVKSARPSQPFEVVHVEHPLTNNLQQDPDSPIIRVVDFKTVLGPLLNNRLFLQQARKIRIARNMTPMMSTTLAGECDQPIRLFQENVTEARLINCLLDPPLAYEDVMFLHIPQAAAQSVGQIMRYVDEPVNLYNTIVN